MPNNIPELIKKIATEEGVNPQHVMQIARIETSGFDQSAVSPKGATGVMQLMPIAVKQLNNMGWYNGTYEDVTDPSRPEENIRAGVLYFKYLLDKSGGDPYEAAVMYNGGEGEFSRVGGNVSQMPQESQNYGRMFQEGMPGQQGQQGWHMPGGPLGGGSQNVGVMPQRPADPQHPGMPQQPAADPNAWPGVFPYLAQQRDVGMQAAAPYLDTLGRAGEQTFDAMGNALYQAGDVGSKFFTGQGLGADRPYDAAPSSIDLGGGVQQQQQSVGFPPPLGPSQGGFSTPESVRSLSPESAARLQEQFTIPPNYGETQLPPDPGAPHMLNPMFALPGGQGQSPIMQNPQWQPPVSYGPGDVPQGEGPSYSDITGSMTSPGGQPQVQPQLPPPPQVPELQPSEDEVELPDGSFAPKASSSAELNADLSPEELKNELVSPHARLAKYLAGYDPRAVSRAGALWALSFTDPKAAMAMRLERDKMQQDAEQQEMNRQMQLQAAQMEQDNVTNLWKWKQQEMEINRRISRLATGGMDAYAIYGAQPNLQQLTALEGFLENTNAWGEQSYAIVANQIKILSSLKGKTLSADAVTKLKETALGPALEAMGITQLSPEGIEQMIQALRDQALQELEAIQAPYYQQAPELVQVGQKISERLFGNLEANEQRRLETTEAKEREAAQQAALKEIMLGTGEQQE